MRKFNMLKTLTQRKFKNSHGRNLVAIAAIILTTLMFTTLFVLTESMSKNDLEMAFLMSGNNAHASIGEAITDEQIQSIAAHPNVKSYGVSILVASAENERLTGFMLEIRYADSNYAENSFALPTTGRLPETMDEIALDEITLDRLGISHELGSQITLEWRKDTNSEEVISSTFTLCGYWEGNAASFYNMAWVNRAFALTACDNAKTNVDGQDAGARTMQIMLDSDSDIQKTMDGILADSSLSELKYDINLAFDPSMQAMAFEEDFLPMYVGMALVFVAGYMIIYNIFQISVADEIRYFGKLKTLGTTKKQIKRLIYGQANRLCLLGIPIGIVLGYLCGVVLVPRLITWTETAPSVSAHPVIFVGAALFAWLTVAISCMRPAILAGRVSPIESLRYTDAMVDSKRSVKKGKSGASLSAMAWANLGRNKKRTITVICSLTLGLVLLSCFYAKNSSFDVEKYLTDRAIADFTVEDASNRDVYERYNPQGKTISDELVAMIQMQEGLESTGRLFTIEQPITLNTQTIQTIKNYFEKPGRLDSMAHNTQWTEGYYEAVENGRLTAGIYGVDNLVLDVIVNDSFIWEGEFDKQKFDSGNYIIAGIGDMGDSRETPPTYSVGDTVNINGKDYTIMLLSTVPYSIHTGTLRSEFSIDFYLPSDVFLEEYPDNTIRKYFFNVSDENIEAADAMLYDYQTNTDSTMPYTSRQSMIEGFEEETDSSAVMGIAVSWVISLVGVLNFVNSMVTSIVSRKKEFAIMQSIGTTKQQLRKMLIYEALFYAGLTLLIAYVVSTLAVGIGVRAMLVGDFTSTFHFTLFPLIVCTPFILFLAVLIPYLFFKNLENKSVVERLRME